MSVVSERRNRDPLAAARGGVGDGGPCAVCGTSGTRRAEIAYHDSPTMVRTMRACPECRFVAIDEITADRYRGRTDVEELPAVGARVGTRERPGREFQMALLAARILKRRRPDVLVYGAGRSMDNHHIAAHPKIGAVAIGDIMKARSDAEVIDITRPAERTFDILVASEVVEHFRNPLPDFERMLSFLSDDGLAICGTSIHSGVSDLSKHRYAFYPDHTSYYSARAIERIALVHGVHFDFRPITDGSRKRYVFLTRSPEVARAVTCWFGSRVFAASELRPLNGSLD